ncbi:MAG: cupin domain-containing protein [Hyperthermus sp.]|nr:MAG: cupin domain-containing protein [Hyperthermus sp.]
MGDCKPLFPGTCSRILYCDDNMAVMETELKKDSTIPAHRHDSTQLTIVLKGSIILGVEGRGEQRLEAGSLLVIEPGRLHWGRALEDSLVIDVNAPLTSDRREIAEKLGASCGGS